MLDKSIIDLFEEQTVLSPDSEAVVCGEERMSYSNLNAQANTLSAYLTSLGIVQGSRVGIALDRSIEFVIAVLGILKAGGAYVPLPSDYPAERLSYMIQDSGMELLITDPVTLLGLPSSGIRTVSMSDSARWMGVQGAENTNRIVSSSWPAYVMYTSGTTGASKGVVIPHRAVIHLVIGQKYANFGPDLKTLLHSPVAFDASTFELWAPLLHGGKCTVFNPSIADFILLEKVLQEEGINCLWIIASLFNYIIDHHPSMLAKLSHLITGGEALSVNHVEKALALLPDTTLTNGYGPTETTTFAFTYAIRVGEKFDRGSVPIGRPLEGTIFHIVDENLQVVPDGTEGELLIGGEGLADGYLNKPELTAEKFIPDRFSGDPAKKLYRSGDRCRLLHDGTLEFLGRLDGQIKLRGMRIELGEIEHALRSHPSIAQVCCLPTLERGEITGIVAHVVSERPVEAQTRLLRKYLAELLPQAFIPSRFIFHDELSLTPNGKINRSALDQLFSQIGSKVESVMPDGDGLTMSIAQIWSEILPLGAAPQESDNFFELGGDSLKVLKLMHGIEGLIGRKLPVHLIYKNPTLGDLINAVRSVDPDDPLLTLRFHSLGSRPPIYIVYNIHGDMSSYIYLIDAFGENQPVIGLRSPALETPSLEPHSIEDAAADLVRRLRMLSIRHPPALIGYSWGGLLAFEVARQWKDLENQAPFLALIGTDCPFRRRGTLSRSWHFVQKFPGWLIHLVSDYSSLKRRLPRLINHLEKLASPPIYAHADEPAGLGFLHMQLAQNYQPPRATDLKIHLFRESFQHQRILMEEERHLRKEGIKKEDHPLYNPIYGNFERSESDGGWSDFAGCSPTIHWIEADHLSIVKPPAINQVAKEIREVMDQFYELPMCLPNFLNEGNQNEPFIGA